MRCAGVARKTPQPPSVDAAFWTRPWWRRHTGVPAAFPEQHLLLLYCTHCVCESTEVICDVCNGVGDLDQALVVPSYRCACRRSRATRFHAKKDTLVVVVLHALHCVCESTEVICDVCNGVGDLDQALVVPSYRCACSLSRATLVVVVLHALRVRKYRSHL
jgi:hypothetical protein